MDFERKLPDERDFGRGRGRGNAKLELEDLVVQEVP